MVDIAFYKKLNYEFYCKAGILSSMEELEEIGIEPPDAVGSFRRSRVEELIAFCKENPTYHIVTRINSYLTVNRFVDGDYIFKLANGDNNPNLVLKFPQEVIDHLDAELNHFIRRYGIGF